MSIEINNIISFFANFCNGQQHCEVNLEDKIDEDFPIYSGFDVFQMEHLLFFIFPNSYSQFKM